MIQLYVLFLFITVTCKCEVGKTSVN